MGRRRGRAAAGSGSGGECGRRAEAARAKGYGIIAPVDLAAITFDCYGTLVDWEAGIWAAFRDACAVTAASGAPGGTGLSREAVLAAYAEIEPAVEAEAFRPYREVLDETARRVAARLGLRIPPARARFLSESLPRWPPFPDTREALERLAQAGLRLGILSNVDDELLLETRRAIGAGVFDPALIVTASQVRSYKPAPAHFLEARRRLGALAAEGRWLHAAQSLFHDVAPAHALGIPVAWINRKGEPLPPDAAPPAIEAPSLAALAARVLSL